MYITAQDLSVPDEILTRLTDDEGAGSPNAARIEAAIESAQAVVDGTIARQYQAPLADPPELIRKLTADIAVYNLYLRTGQIPTEVKEACATARTTLEKIGCGEVSIGEPPFTSVQMTSQPREFSRSFMEGF